MSIVSVAFADDHPVVLQGMANIFASDARFTVVGKCACAADAVEMCSAVRPDVLVTDLNMPGDSIGAIRDITSMFSTTRVVAFTVCSDVDAAANVLEAGASGYVLKGSTIDELRSAILAAFRGETFITQSLAAKVVSVLRTTASDNRNKPMRFSVREEQVVKLLLCGQTNKEIAANLNLSEKTVKHYMGILIQKFHVRNRLEVAMAVRSAPNRSSSSGVHSFN